MKSVLRGFPSYCSTMNTWKSAFETLIYDHSVLKTKEKIY